MSKLNSFFEEDFFLTVQSSYQNVVAVSQQPFYIVAINDTVWVNLIPLDTTFSPQDYIDVQDAYNAKSQMLIHLWEDVWLAKRFQVLSRINSFCGLNQSLHGRKAKVSEISSADAKTFLEEHHLQGYIKTKYLLSLNFDGETYAVACFSGARIMKSKGAHYQSAELVRFATKTGYTIAGGLGKLIRAFLKQVQVNDLMTYADRDWSLGKGYSKLGFDLTNTTPSTSFYFDLNTLQRYVAHRLPKETSSAFNAQIVLNLEDFMISRGFAKVFNTGNLKYHFYPNV